MPARRWFVDGETGDGRPWDESGSKMEIGPIRNEQPDFGRVESDRQESVAGNAVKPTGDRVEISDNARLKLAELADLARRECRPAGNGSDRLEKVQRRIDSGFYDHTTVKGIIADRLTSEFESPSAKDKRSKQ
ncbi:MAG: hypothetical protein ABII79_11600 [bacterium]